jgi:hypothetical protein
MLTKINIVENRGNNTIWDKWNASFVPGTRGIFEEREG